MAPGNRRRIEHDVVLRRPADGERARQLAAVHAATVGPGEDVGMRCLALHGAKCTLSLFAMEPLQSDS